MICAICGMKLKFICEQHMNGKSHCYYFCPECETGWRATRNLANIVDSKDDGGLGDGCQT